MQLAVTLEHHFVRTPDGAVWTSGLNAHNFWTRYLSVFDGVKVVARIEDVTSPRPDFTLASGPGVVFLPVPDYLGPVQYLSKAFQVRSALRNSIDRSDAVIMRVPSHMAGCLESKLVHLGHPYGLEVVGDPYDVYAEGAVRHPLRPLFRWWFTRQLRRQCIGAAAAAYVTERALQVRYPCPAYSVGVSDVEISESAVRQTAEGMIDRRHAEGRRDFRLVTVASLAQMYKAPDVLIRAVGECVAKGFDLTLQVVGDGRYRPELERLCCALGLADRVRFPGHLPAGDRVRAELDRSDLFALPSWTEGLPRAMVEAMARALPCIGSDVGGIPELLPEEDLVPPGDVGALAGKIQEVLSSRRRMAEMSVRNLAKAREYRDDLLAGRRQRFFDHVRLATLSWLEECRRVKCLEGAEFERCRP